MSDNEVTFDSKPLNQIIKAMKEKGFITKIGILGQKDARIAEEKNGALSNATVGAAHEFGTSKLPVRSFLRMPITEKLPKELENAGLFDEDSLKEIVKSGNMRPYVEKLSIAAVAVVLDAFDTGGFGKWPQLNEAYKIWKAKNSKKGKSTVNQILVFTQQLRDSISYEIREKS